MSFENTNTPGDKPALTPTAIRNALAAARRSTQSLTSAKQQLDLELVRFNGENAAIDFNIDLGKETLWASRAQIADLFGKDVNTIAHHIDEIFGEGELDREATTSKFGVVRLEGGRQVSREVEHFNLDVMISVGYRVKSPDATKFRQWATKTLRAYITEGYALNEQRLRNDPEALRKLAAEVRALRAEEKQVYESVRECFKLSASDYDAASPTTRTFYARLQDKFLYAATGKTACEIVLDRADGTKPNMGLTVIKGSAPTKAEAKVGKNYLLSDELYILHILCEQFLLYAESKAMRGQRMTMAALDKKLDQLLTTNEYPVFMGYGGYLKDRAIEHAELEYQRLMLLIEKGEHLG